LSKYKVMSMVRLGSGYFEQFYSVYSVFILLPKPLEQKIITISHIKSFSYTMSKIKVTSESELIKKIRFTPM
jgi:hypothetical protein